MESKTKLSIIMRRIENLRNEMVQSFLQNGTDMSNPQVLRLSRLLDDQLNKYERCKREIKSGSSSPTVKSPLFIFRNPHVVSQSGHCF
ncbi:aspartyl-phosphate phosphatase Spo0E family protein [Cohnella herbarum]|uniref:Aspartyl-phosphate phosphatase Spo0E family protein n=1 Tax=Cohnella herbarum TaxID=2728023 RepID=A0A7Z2VJT5_9BACL|nr:aspartyl-phosphate phosphatase Spo0E family protein [Cohnella herbarum]QJD84150.1 aspartyl-phosphate phosphatase Spo0E family protein [Cohnella herbarum]